MPSSVPPSTPDSPPDPVLVVLEQVSRTDGPARLFAPRSAPRRGGAGMGKGTGLFRRRTSVPSVFLEQLLGGLLDELPRSRNHPREVVLSDHGIHLLMRQASPAERATRVRLASPLYRDRLLRAWKRLAAPGEAAIFRACLEECFGEVLTPEPGPGAAAEPVRLSDAESLKRAMAKELVLSWERAELPEVRHGLARAMVALGLREQGRVGDRVLFSGKLHAAAGDASLFKGDPVEILEPGWTVTDSAGDLLLRKALVQPLPLSP